MTNLFAAYKAWDEYCRENKIKDPFKALEDLRNEYTEYYFQPESYRTDIIISDMTEEQKIREIQLKKDRDNYIQDRRLWVAKYILENYGYDELINFAQNHSGAGQSGPPSDFAVWLNSIRPCEGKNGECSIFCPDFNNCNKEI